MVHSLNMGIFGSSQDMSGQVPTPGRHGCVLSPVVAKMDHFFHTRFVVFLCALCAVKRIYA